MCQALFASLHIPLGAKKDYSWKVSFVSVGEDGDLLNLGEKKKKKKKKQTTEAVVSDAMQCVVDRHASTTCSHSGRTLQEEALAEATAGGEEDEEAIPELGLGLDKKKKKKKKREVSPHQQSVFDLAVVFCVYRYH